MNVKKLVSFKLVTLKRDEESLYYLFGSFNHWLDLGGVQIFSFEKATKLNCLTFCRPLAVPQGHLLGLSLIFTPLIVN